MSGLSSGAKLELVQLSRSAGVVSVALQLPESEAQGIPNARLTDKFPSTTTLWLVLRKFEAGVAGGSTGSKNLTAKGAPATSSGNTGAGRLYYEQPVIQVMGRELASFTDLQKSLSQLGVNTGSILLRLSYRTSETPLEEALTQIQQYFDSVGGQATSAAAAQPTPTQQLTQAAGDVVMTEPTPSEAAGPALTSAQPVESDSRNTVPGTTDEPESVSVGNRPVSVFRPPTASTPSAAMTSFNEADFTPTVEHAQIHQKLLQQSTLNKRLLTDAQLEQQAREEEEKWSAIKNVEIKVRFPDQSSVSAKFNQTDSAADLYSFARGCLDDSFRDQPFMLRNPGVRGKGEILPDEPKKLLIKNLLLKGRVLVVFGWSDQASAQARGARTVLKMSLRSQAQEIQAPQIQGLQDEEDDPGVKINVSKKEESGGGEGSSGKKMPKWLKGLAKK